jgi:predicted AAA+ superfamily ATPase
VFDEIQVVPGWERFVRRLVDGENVHVCVSGSSSKMLSKEIASSLRGRSLATELFPFSFREFLRHHGVEPGGRGLPGKQLRSSIEQKFGEYLRGGGFPEVQGLDDGLRRRVLQEYLDVVMLRDVIERHNVSNVAALRRMMRRLLSSPAGLFSINRLHNDFRSQGIQVSKDSLHAFLDHLHDAYLYYPVAIHTESERVRQSNPRKIYPVDTGLVAAGSPRGGWGTGQLLETLVFLELRRQGLPIAYYKHDDGTEVDFVVEREQGLELIQVSADVTSTDTRRRELRALEAAMRDYGVEEATLVTVSADERVKVRAGTMRVVPFWRWALGLG